MAQMTCGTMLAHLLDAHGVRHVFGIPGVHNVELYRGLWQTRIRHVSPRHEQGAGFMADGYARSTGRPGVAFVITGPGLTNIATPMGQAYGDSVPMLVLAAVNRRHELALGRGYLHEMPNQRNLAAGLAAFAHTLLRPDELGDVLDAAFSVFTSSRPRPVAIEIPIDVMEQKVEFEPGSVKPRRITPPGPDPQAVGEMASLLRAAKRVMIIAGGGAIGAAEEIRKLAEALHAPVQLTTNARGLLPVDHPLNADFGIGSADGRKVMNGAGVVLAIGTEMGETDYDFYATTPFAVEAPFLRIDVDPRQIAIGPRPTVGLVSDARLAVAALNAAIGTGAVKHDQRWTEAAIKTLGEIAYRNREPDDAFYDRFMTTVREAARDPIVVGDSTKPAYRAQATYRAPNPRSFFCSGTGFGTLGYALPAAIGAKVANADRNVVCLIGDGGAQFTLPELISAREAKAGIVMLVWNNNGYREIKDYMVAKEIKPVAVDVSPPDFCTFAKSVGVKGVRVDTLDALAKALSGHAPTSDQPLLIEAGPWMIE